MKKLLSLAAVVIGLNAYQIDIKSGWQLKGALEDINVTGVFNKQEIVSVWTYNDETNTWRAYVPNMNVNLDSHGIEPLNIIHQGEGFWVNASNNLVIETNISENIQNIDENVSNDEENITTIIDTQNEENTTNEYNASEYVKYYSSIYNLYDLNQYLTKEPSPFEPNFLSEEYIMGINENGDYINSSVSEFFCNDTDNFGFVYNFCYIEEYGDTFFNLPQGSFVITDAGGGPEEGGPMPIFAFEKIEENENGIVAIGVAYVDYYSNKKVELISFNKNINTINPNEVLSGSNKFYYLENDYNTNLYQNLLEFNYNGKGKNITPSNIEEFNYTIVDNKIVIDDRTIEFVNKIDDFYVVKSCNNNQCKLEVISTSPILK